MAHHRHRFRRRILLGPTELDWQPHSHEYATLIFFDPGLTDPKGAFRRSILRRAKATFLITDCSTAPTFASDIDPVARPVTRFGCVTVYNTT